MKQIIKIKAGDFVPDGAKFLFEKSEYEFSHKGYSYGFLYDTVKTYYKPVTYLYFEISDSEKSKK